MSRGRPTFTEIKRAMVAFSDADDHRTLRYTNRSATPMWDCLNGGLPAIERASCQIASRTSPSVRVWSAALT
jgi:hypothetical protein